MALVTVARFVDPPSAHLARGLLETNGIDAFVFNEHYVGMDWLHSQAIGGVELRVVSEQAAQARALLADPPMAPEPVSDGVAMDDPVEGPTCPRCGSSGTHPDRLDHRLRALSLAVGVPLAVGRDRYRCTACDETWRVRPRHRGFVLRLVDGFVLVGSLIASVLSLLMRLPRRFVETMLGRKTGRRRECWACGTPFRIGEPVCAACGVRHPPAIALDRVVDVGRAYDASCARCHTPYVRADYAGSPSGWRCSICKAPLHG